MLCEHTARTLGCEATNDSRQGAAGPYPGCAGSAGNVERGSEIDVGAGLAHSTQPAGRVLSITVSWGSHSSNIDWQLGVDIKLLQPAQQLREGGVLHVARVMWGKAHCGRRLSARCSVRMTPLSGDQRCAPAAARRLADPADARTQTPASPAAASCSSAANPPAACPAIRSHSPVSVTLHLSTRMSQS